MDIIFPVVLLNPGLSATPSKVSVPLSLENTGSSAHKVIKEPAFEIETTERESGGYVTRADAALIASILLLTTKSTVNVFPTLTVTDDGEILRLAADTVSTVTYVQEKIKATQ